MPLRRRPRRSAPHSRATSSRLGRGPEADVLAWVMRHVDRTYRRGNWAGSGSLPSFEGISSEAAHRQIHPDQHTIAEIVLHMAYWKDAVTARLSGKRWTYSDEGNWRPAGPGEEGWRAAQVELAAAHARLMRALKSLAPDRLLQPLWRRWTAIDFVAGAAAHDMYHAAQIFVLRKLAGQPRRR